MPRTRLEIMAQIAIDLLGKSPGARVKVRAPDGAFIEVGGKELRGTILQEFLTGLDPELERKRQGAWQTLEGSTADRHAQAAHSMREVLQQLLDRLAPREQVERAPWYSKLKQGQGVTRSMRVRWAIAGDSTNISQSLLRLIDSLAEAVDATYARLSAEGHERKAGKDRSTRACLSACDSLIELIGASREDAV